MRINRLNNIWLALLIWGMTGCQSPFQPNPVRTEETGSIVYENPAAGTTEVSGFVWPFVVDEMDLNNTTMSDGKTVVINNPQAEWMAEIEETNLANGWRLVSDEKFFDGGSREQIYFLEAREPMVKMFFKWDLTAGRFTGLSIDLIHPADVAKTLIDIRSQKAVRFEEFNIEELLGCPGTVGEYQTGAYACIGDDNEVIEWY